MRLYDVILVIHIFAGTLALVAGPIPMFSAKGGPTHRKWGLVYFTAMVVTTVAALVLAILRSDILLLAIAVFSFFLVFRGLRAVRRLRGMPLGGWDMLVAGACLLFSVGLFAFGLPPVGGAWNVPALFFGVIGTRVAIEQVRALRAPDEADWLDVHLKSMGGGYVATVTAALLVNVQFLPSTLVFIAPTLVGTLLLLRASRKYARRQPA